MSGVNNKYILEAALFSSPEPLTLGQLQQLFEKQDRLSLQEIKNLLSELSKDYQGRGVELCQVASGYRFQARPSFALWLQRLYEKKTPRYSQALLETLALIAYRQPISRGEIEKVRGVTVSPEIMKKLLDREWIKVEGYKDVPGKPALYVTTKAFLDYFNLKKIADLPPLEKVIDLEEKSKREQLISITSSREIGEEKEYKDQLSQESCSRKFL